MRRPYVELLELDISKGRDNYIVVRCHVGNCTLNVSNNFISKNSPNGLEVIFNLLDNFHVSSQLIFKICAISSARLMGECTRLETEREREQFP